MIHIYTGDGKGKTTASVGLAMRSKGAGMNVLFIQFLKDGKSSEISLLSQAGIDVLSAECNKFTFLMNEKELHEICSVHNNLLKKIDDYKADVVILDEFFGAYNNNLLDKNLAESIIFNYEGEIILTGRNAPPEYVKRADYVTLMEKIKHPYDNGTAARKGIEF